jgi:hypothetical protein
MTYGEGYFVGIALAFLLYVLVRHIDRNYYHRKMELLSKRKAKLSARKIREESTCK